MIFVIKPNHSTFVRYQSTKHVLPPLLVYCVNCEVEINNVTAEERDNDEVEVRVDSEGGEEDEVSH